MNILHLIYCFAAIFYAPILLNAEEESVHEEIPCDSNGKIAFSSYISGNWDLWTVRPDGGNLTQITNTEIEELYPAWSPDCTKISYATNEGRIWTLNIDKNTPQPISLPPHSTHPSWSPDNSKIAFVSFSFQGSIEDSDIWIADIKQGKFWKLATLKGIQKHPAWSPDGSNIVYTTVYRAGETRDAGDLWLIDSNGVDPRVLVSNGYFNTEPAWSADGEQIAFSSNLSGNMDIWVVDRHGMNARQLTFDNSYDADPSWSPDSTEISFLSTRNGKTSIWIMDSNGRNCREITGLSGIQAESKEPHWSPCGSVR